MVNLSTGFCTLLDNAGKSAQDRDGSRVPSGLLDRERYPEFPPLALNKGALCSSVVTTLLKLNSISKISLARARAIFSRHRNVFLSKSFSGKRTVCTYSHGF